jgi:hypothetical protein
MPSLHHLQKHQPWTVPYSTEFESSKRSNPLRPVSHDLMHIMKAVGRMTAQCEKRDHTDVPVTDRTVFIENIPDLVICAMHLATIFGFDLEDEVVAQMERRNGVRIQPED